MNTNKVSILSKSENTLELYVRNPNIIAKGVIQINTGTCIPQKIYWKFAEFLTKNGFITITYDYSDSTNYSSDISHTAWLLDIESVTDFILQNYPNEKKYAIGHSSGAQLIGYSNNCHQFDKIYLVAASNGYINNLSLPLRFVMLLFWKIIVPYSIKKYGYMNNKIIGSSGGFPKNIILELKSWCFNRDFFIPFFKEKNIPSYYHTIKNPVKEYHLADDVIANRKSCEYILNLYTNASKSIETLHAKDFEMKKFGHRGFYFESAEKILWPKFLKDLEN